MTCTLEKFVNNEDICGICLDKQKLPYTLICKHTFCYLCIKEYLVAGTNNACPLCRSDICASIFEDATSVIEEAKTIWLYASRSGDGWWYYDNDTSDAIEKGWTKYTFGGTNIVSITILGMNCIIDFLKMEQKTKFSTRSIKRCDKLTPEDFIKGNSGLRKIEA